MHLARAIETSPHTVETRLRAIERSLHGFAPVIRTPLRAQMSMPGAMARRQTGPKERYRRLNYWHNHRLPMVDALLPQSVAVRLRLLCIIWV
ncbi:MAG: hypothetical protein ACK5ZU_16775 [Acidobacteriota bacterium]